MTAPQTHPKQLRAKADQEREAAAAEQVAVPGLGSATGLVARRSMIRRDSDDPLGGGAVTDEIAGVLRRRRGGGEALPEGLSGAFGSHFGQDLSGVRMHTDPEAGQVAQSLQSTAFTHGNDIYFAPGAYRPGSDEGQRLIAHELSHVVAQRTGADRGGAGPLSVGHAHDPAEAAADRSAGEAMTSIRRSAHPAPVESDDGPRGAAVVPELRRDLAEPPLRRFVGIGRHRDQTGEKPKNTLGNGSGTYSGVTTETREVAQTQRGGSVGSHTETTAASKTGGWHSATVSEEVFNGKSKRKREGSIKSIAGAEAWAKLIREASDDKLYLAVETLARAGAFSSGSGSVSYERGLFSTGASGSYDASAGIAGGTKASVTMDTSGLIPAVEAACNAWIRAGAGLDAQADVFAKLWQLEFLATGKVSLFAGFEASATGKAWANWKEVGASGSVEAFGGVRGSASGSASLKLGPAELAVMGEAAAKAGAWAKASGKIAISFTGVEISGEAEAFAGVSATAKGSAALKFRGVPILAAHGEVSVDAGVGGKVKGTFIFKDGKIAFDFGAKAVLGWGAGANAGMEIDLFALGKAISIQVYESINKYTLTITEDAGLIDRQPIVDKLQAAAVKKLGYDIYIPHFRGYAASKFSSGKNGVKRERVQEILDEYRGAIGRNLIFAEADDGIMTAAREAFGGMLKKIMIVGGRITEFDAVTTAEIGEVRVTQAQLTAKSAMRAALTKQSDKGRTGTDKKPGTHLPSDAMINKALSDTYKKLLAAYDGDKAQADAQAAALVDEVFAQFLRNASVRDGKFSSAIIDLKGAADADKEARQNEMVAGRLKALSALSSACSAYTTKKASKGKNGIKQDEVAKLIAEHAAPLLGVADQEVADRVITSTVRRALGAAIIDFAYSGGEITEWKIASVADIKAAHALDVAAGKRREKYADAKRQIAAYVAKKTGKGKNGIKLAEIQSIVGSIYKKIPKEFQPEADGALATAVEEGGGGMVWHVSMSGGLLAAFLNDVGMKAAKDKHAADAARVGKNFGDDQGNDRRYDVARKVRPAMQQYLAELLSTPDLVPEIGRLQALIDRAMSSRRDELAFEDAQAELALTINRVFEGVLTVTLDKDGKIQKMSRDPRRLIAIRAQNPYRTAAAKAAKKYVGSLGKKAPTAAGLTEALGKVPVTGIDGDTRDTVLVQVIQQAFADKRVTSVKVTGGKVSDLVLAW